MINIGDRVIISHSTMAHATGKKATVVDRMYSEAKNLQIFRVRIDGSSQTETTSYRESDLTPINEAEPDFTKYKVEIDVAENIVVATMYKVENGKKESIKCGHGHVLHDGIIGIAQATSYATKKLFESINGGSLTLDKNNGGNY